MKTFIRNELDLTKPVNLRRLTPLMKIYAGVVTMWHNTEFYTLRLNKQLEEENLKNIRRDERLKGVILTQIYKELGKNQTLQEKGKVCQTIIISVDAKYQKALQRVLSHKDFLPYTIEIVKENEDIRKAFSDMPVLIKVSKRVI